MRGLVAGIVVVGVVGLAVWMTGSGAWAQGVHGPGTHAPASTPASSPTSGPAGKYKDGTYTGQAAGHKSQIVMEIKIADGKIVSANVTKQGDDAAWYNRAAAIIPQIVEKQGIQGVNTVTGATRSSRGILGAAKAALDKASGQPAASQPSGTPTPPPHSSTPPRR